MIEILKRAQDQIEAHNSKRPQHPPYYLGRLSAHHPTVHIVREKYTHCGFIFHPEYAAPGETGKKLCSTCAKFLERLSR